MRDERRAHRERLKKKRKHYYRGQADEKRVAMYVDTPKTCSCYMCGNPRRFFKADEKLTVQERRFECLLERAEELVGDIEVDLEEELGFEET